MCASCKQIKIPTLECTWEWDKICLITWEHISDIFSNTQLAKCLLPLSTIATMDCIQCSWMLHAISVHPMWFWSICRLSNKLCWVMSCRLLSVLKCLEAVWMWITWCRNCVCLANENWAHCDGLVLAVCDVSALPEGGGVGNNGWLLSGGRESVRKHLHLFHNCWLNINTIL